MDEFPFFQYTKIWKSHIDGNGGLFINKPISYEQENRFSFGYKVMGETWLSIKRKF